MEENATLPAETGSEGTSAPAETPVETTPADDGSARSDLARAFATLDKPEETEEQTSKRAEAAAKRARDEAGRFAPGSPEAKAAEAKAVKVEKPEAEKPQTALRAPDHWTPADKALFEKIPDPNLKVWALNLEKRAQAAIGKREAEYQRARKGREDLDKIVDAHAPEFWQQGINPNAAVAEAFQWARAFRANPVQAVTALAQRYGIDLAKIAAPQGQEPYVDPILSAQQQRIDAIEREWRQRQAAEQQAMEAQRQQQLQTYESLISRVRNATDAQGSPLRPHWDSVRDEIMIRIGDARRRNPHVQFTERDLQAFYDNAVWANPQTREAVIASREKQAQAQTAEQQKARVETARRASQSLAPQPIPSRPAPHVEPDSTKESLALAMRQLGLVPG